MTDRQDRLIFSLAMAVSVMIHAAVLWGVSWQEHEALPPQRHSVTPLQLILLPREQSSVAIPVKKEGSTQSEEDPVAAQQLVREQQLIKEQKADYFTVLHAMIDASKTYPTRALRRRLEGSVVVRVVVDDMGALVSAVIAQGDENFEAASLDAVRRAAPFPPLPASLGERLVFDVPLYYRLR